MQLNIFSSDNIPASRSVISEKKSAKFKELRAAKKDFKRSRSEGEGPVLGASLNPIKKKYQPHYIKDKHIYEEKVEEGVEAYEVPVVNAPPGAKREEVDISLPKLKRQEVQNIAKNDRGSKESKKVLVKEGFAALGLDTALCTHLTAIGYTAPTRIQAGAIPSIIRRKDTMVKSHTGSGKTLAFLLPVINDFIYRPVKLMREAGTHAIIITPTRELAIQIDNVFKEVSKPFHWLVSTTLLGGENKKAEKSRLRKGAQLVIGTPGRIKDHMETTQSWSLSQIRWFILDEADRLMDLGFSETMEAIYKFVDVVANKERDIRCNVLVSATLKQGDDVDSLAKVVLRNPVYIGFDDTDHNIPEKRKIKGEEDSESDSSSSDSDSEDSSTEKKKKNKVAAANDDPNKYITPDTLRQLYVEMSSRHRLVTLGSFLRLRITSAHTQKKHCKVIVFVSTCASVEFLHKLFTHTFWPDTETMHAANITNSDLSGAKPEDATNKDRQPLLNTQLWKLHGNMPQSVRSDTFLKFGKAKEGILFCTDVAARGLDLPSVDWIIQYDAPEDVQDYVHRVGRTARIGHKGDALLFLVESEKGYLDILKSKGIALEQIPLERMLAGLHVGLEKGAMAPVMGPMGRPLPSGAVLQRQLETMVQVSPLLGNLAKEAYISFFRSYAAYPKDLKHIFHPKRLHFGEVAHSFGLIDKPTDIGKRANEYHEETMATIAPMQAAKMEKEKLKNKPKTLQQLARSAGRRGDLQEFM